jgi:hypothetical protein
MVDVEEGAKAICSAIELALENDAGSLIGRNGTIELDMMLHETIDYTRLPILERNAGIYPLSQHSIFYRWKEQSIKATKSADILAAGWYAPLKDLEASEFEKWNVTATRIPLRSLEPYYVEPPNQWIKYLSGQRVAVVSSFTKTAQSQVARLDAIWGSTLDWPANIDWCWIQTGHPRSVAKGTNEWPPHIHSWLQAAEYVVSEVMATGARFALIGCGGLSMPIAKMLKDRGIISIVLGGAIQVLFGIKGQRWQTHVLSRFWNDSWVWPSDDETPGGASTIEGGCYWRAKN